MDADELLDRLGLDEYATVDEAVLAFCKVLRAAGYEPECVWPYESLAQMHERR